MSDELVFAPPPRPVVTVALRPRPISVAKLAEEPADPCPEPKPSADRDRLERPTGKRRRPVAAQTGRHIAEPIPARKAGESVAESFAARPKEASADRLARTPDEVPEAETDADADADAEAKPPFEHFALERGIDFVLRTTKDDRDAWRALGLNTPTISGKRLGKLREQRAEQLTWTARLLSATHADVTVGDHKHRINALSAWALEAASAGPQAFTDFLHAHGGDPNALFDLVHIVPTMFSAEAVAAVLPMLAIRMRELEEQQAKNNARGMWRNGCRMVEGLIKNLMENPPVTMAADKLALPFQKDGRFPLEYVAAANVFQHTETQLLDRFKNDRTERTLISEWFSGAASRRFCAPAFKRSRPEGKFLEHVHNITAHLHPRGGAPSRQQDRAYILRESGALNAAKHVGGSVAHGAGWLVKAMFAGNSAHAAVYGNLAGGYAPLHRAPSPPPAPAPRKAVSEKPRQPSRAHARLSEDSPAPKRKPAPPPRRPMEDENGAGPSNYAGARG